MMERKFINFSSSLFILILLAGCKGIQSTSPYEQMDNSYNLFTMPLEGSTNKQIADGGDLTLQQALKIAKVNNPNLASLRFNVAKAAAVAEQMHALRTPQLNIVGSAGMFSEEQRIVPPSKNGEFGSFANGIFSMELVLSYPLYTGGKLKAGSEAAMYANDMNEAKFKRACAEVKYNISQIFAKILVQKKLIESLCFNENVLKNHKRRVNDLILSNKATKVDMLRIEVRIADLQQQLTRNNNNLQIAKQILANLLGLEQAKFVVVGKLLNSGNKEQLDLKTENLLADAQENRADFAALRWGLYAQAKRIDMVKAERKPIISAWAAYGGRWGLDADDGNFGGDDAADSGRIGISINFPLWDGGLRKAKIVAEQMELATLQKRYYALQQRICLEVKTASLNLQSASTRAVATKKAMEQAKEVLKLQQESQILGKATITDVLDAQSAFLVAQTNYYIALAEYQTADAELKLAIGTKE